MLNSESDDVLDLDDTDGVDTEEYEMDWLGVEDVCELDSDTEPVLEVEDICEPELEDELTCPQT